MLRKATHFGTINIGGKDLSCAVLEDETRVLTQTALFQAFDRSRMGRRGAEQIGSNLPSFMLSDNIKPFINAGLEVRVNFEEKYIGKNKKEFIGYNAEILPHICDAFLKARDAGVLTDNQQSLAIASDILVRSLAKVGIIALIDEATGYQQDREIDALNKLLKLYIAEELMPWQKKFPDIYYNELCRLNGWPKDYIMKRPSVVGTWTNKLIYEQLPPGILEYLKNNTPKTTKGHRKHRFFQLLTEDIGEPHLKGQLNQIITLFQLSDNMQHMWTQFEKLKQRQAGHLELPFQFDEKGYTIAPVEESLFSNFDKDIKKTLY